MRTLLRKIFVVPIVLYQKTLSIDHGPLRAVYPDGLCKFYPTCSEYTRRSILKDGVVRGILKGTWRILRCHPFSQGGVDEP